MRLWQMTNFPCDYCNGYRCPCTCAEDCGARPRDAGHCCLEAPRTDVLASGVTADAYDRRHPAQGTP